MTMHFFLLLVPSFQTCDGRHFPNCSFFGAIQQDLKIKGFHHFSQIYICTKAEALRDSTFLFSFFFLICVTPLHSLSSGIQFSSMQKYKSYLLVSSEMWLASVKRPVPNIQFPCHLSTNDLHLTMRLCGCQKLWATKGTLQFVLDKV